MLALQTKADSKAMISSQRTQALDHECKEAGLFILFATVDASKGYGASRRFDREKLPGFYRRKKKTSGDSGVFNLRVDSGRLPRAQGERAREVGKDTNRDRNAERRPHRNWARQMLRSASAWNMNKVWQERTPFGKRSISRNPVPDRPDGNRDRGSAPDGL